MADDPKAPVAIRITRPYATENDFLEREFDTLTRTSVILLGAQSRPQGVVLRFEIVLRGGDSILRGEGRVVGYKDRAYNGEPGLTLRFTRLDARSKSLVDRAGLMREARAKASASGLATSPVAVPVPAPEREPEPEAPPPPPAPSSGASSGAGLSAERESVPPSSSGLETSRGPAPPAIPSSPPSRRGPPPLPEWAQSQHPPPVSSSSVPPPPPSSSIEVEIESTQVDATFHRPVEAPAPPKPRTPLPPPLPARARSKAPPPLKATGASGTAGAVSATIASGIDRPKDREALLHRLRTRGQALPPARVSEILSKRAARSR